MPTPVKVELAADSGSPSSTSKGSTASSPETKETELAQSDRKTDTTTTPKVAKAPSKAIKKEVNAEKDIQKKKPIKMLSKRKFSLPKAKALPKAKSLPKATKKETTAESSSATATAAAAEKDADHGDLDEADDNNNNNKRHKRSWEESFQALVVFKDQHGHCQVPVHNYVPDTRLGGWVNQQRARRTKLSPHQTAQLNSIGFQWTVKARSKHWKEMMGLLEHFQKKYGHVHVLPATTTNVNGTFMYHSKYESLAVFCQDQRQSRANQKMSAARQEELTKLGFCWTAEEAHQQVWKHYHKKLQQFVDAEGHIRVPLQTKKGHKNALGYWLVQQRRTYKQQMDPEFHKDDDDTANASFRLTAEQISLLSQLDYNWMEGDDGSQQEEKERKTKKAKKEVAVKKEPADKPKKAKDDTVGAVEPKATVPVTKKEAGAKAVPSVLPKKRPLSLPTKSKPALPSTCTGPIQMNTAEVAPSNDTKGTQLAPSKDAKAVPAKVESIATADDTANHKTSQDVDDNPKPKKMARSIVEDADPKTGAPDIEDKPKVSPKPKRRKTKKKSNIAAALTPLALRLCKLLAKEEAQNSKKQRKKQHTKSKVAGKDEPTDKTAAVNDESLTDANLADEKENTTGSQQEQKQQSIIHTYEQRIEAMILDTEERIRKHRLEQELKEAPVGGTSPDKMVSNDTADDDNSMLH